MDGGVRGFSSEEEVEEGDEEQLPILGERKSIPTIHS